MTGVRTLAAGYRSPLTETERLFWEFTHHGRVCGTVHMSGVIHSGDYRSIRSAVSFLNTDISNFKCQRMFKDLRRTPRIPEGSRSMGPGLISSNRNGLTGLGHLQKGRRGLGPYGRSNGYYNQAAQSRILVKAHHRKSLKAQRGSYLQMGDGAAQAAKGRPLSGRHFSKAIPFKNKPVSQTQESTIRRKTLSQK
ncbi:hypothetical protein F0562_032951 [Nyssa sinensis]|uniref:Uncharacterized protein n=1 Tax=Nyssa sinensis TaxID=561372 RepID=A0A5J5AT78_9ASTE|nr:hypothetical protein F0562_032951 [Nyssa sinensis]